MNRVSEEQLKEAINGFQFEGNLISIKPYGSGHINDTYLLTYEIGKNGINKSDFAKSESGDFY